MGVVRYSGVITKAANLTITATVPVPPAFRKAEIIVRETGGNPTFGFTTTSGTLTVTPRGGVATSLGNGTNGDMINLQWGIKSLLSAMGVADLTKGIPGHIIGLQPSGSASFTTGEPDLTNAFEVVAFALIRDATPGTGTYTIEVDVWSGEDSSLRTGVPLALTLS